MQYQRQGISFQFGSGLTQTGKILLIVYVTIYIFHLILEHWVGLPVFATLALWPFNSPYFHIWQIITHPFIHHPSDPLWFLIDCLILYFFMGHVEKVFGRKGFLILFYLSALGGAICGLLFGRLFGFNALLFGMMPSLLAIIVVFGLLNPEATVFFMFVLPLKAKYISYVTVILALVMFLAKADHAIYNLGGILFGYVYLKGPGALSPRWLYIKYLEWKLKKKRSRFNVIVGFKKDDDDDRPTYH